MDKECLVGKGIGCQNIFSFCHDLTDVTACDIGLRFVRGHGELLGFRVEDDEGRVTICVLSDSRIPSEQVEERNGLS